MYSNYAGRPVAWCISDRETAEVIDVFLRCIQEQSPDVQVKVLMTEHLIMHLPANTVARVELAVCRKVKVQNTQVFLRCIQEEYPDVHVKD